MTNLLTIKQRQSHGAIIWAALVLLILSGCYSVPISYYDTTTYTQLTSLKAETTLLVKSFDRKSVVENSAKVETTILNFQKAYEYEKGKGEPNSDTSKQFDKISDLFLEIIDEYQEDGPGALGEKYFQQAAVLLGRAFDIAIATERQKNKGQY